MDIQRYLESLNISSGGSKRIDCPYCGGTNTFSVSNNFGTLLYHCYRSSCQVAGRCATRVSLEDVKHRLNNNKETQFVVPKHFIKLPIGPMKHYKMLRRVIPAVQQDMISVYKDIKEQRLCFLIKDKHGVVVDAVGRTLIVGKKPKWKRYGKSKQPFIVGPKTGICVVVEDVLSACAVAATGKYSGCALLGTNLYSGILDTFSVFEKAIVALDYDASSKGIEIAKKLSWTLPSTSIIIKEDFKNWNIEDIKKELDSVEFGGTC